jgi:hypothetical protein
MTTFSTALKLELPGDGQQTGTWGQTTNKNIGTLLEQAITGVQNITMMDANYTLSNLNGVSDEARNAVIVVTGTNSAVRDVIAPLVNKLYLIVNNTTGGYAIRIRGASGDPVTIANGACIPVYCDGADFFTSLNATAGDFFVNGNETVTGTLGVTGAISGSTATFSGAISSVSPVFTGTPTAPTAVAGTNNTQIATTAFVTNVAATSFPSGGIIMWSGSIASIPAGWYLCNGSNGTPDLRDRFIVGAGSTYSVAGTGGSKDAIVVSHSHSINDPSHSHGYYRSYENQGIRYTDHSGQDTYEGWVYNDTGASTTGISVNSAGSSGTNANLPPYYALAFIMKA